MKVPHRIEPTVTRMDWLPTMQPGTIYRFFGERQTELGEKTTITEFVKVLAEDGTVKRGDLLSVVYRWESGDEFEVAAMPWMQADSRTGLGYLNPHECPVCGQMHHAD